MNGPDITKHKAAQLFKGRAGREWAGIAKALGRLPADWPDPDSTMVRVEIVAGGKTFYALSANPEYAIAHAYHTANDGKGYMVDLLFLNEGGRWFIAEVTS